MPVGPLSSVNVEPYSLKSLFFYVNTVLIKYFDFNMNIGLIYKLLCFYGAEIDNPVTFVLVRSFCSAALTVRAELFLFTMTINGTCGNQGDPDRAHPTQQGNKR